jgi:hypothetical protein
LASRPKFSSVGEIAELNWQTVQTALAENQELLTKAFSENNAQGFLCGLVGVGNGGSIGICWFIPGTNDLVTAVAFIYLMQTGNGG